MNSLKHFFKAGLFHNTIGCIFNLGLNYIWLQLKLHVHLTYTQKSEEFPFHLEVIEENPYFRNIILRVICKCKNSKSFHKKKGYRILKSKNLLFLFGVPPGLKLLFSCLSMVIKQNIGPQYWPIVSFNVKGKNNFNLRGLPPNKLFNFNIHKRNER